MKPAHRLTRRQFNQSIAEASLAIGAGAAANGWAAGSAADARSLRSIESLGMFVKECSLPGETRADGVVPCHGSCVQLSRDRWLYIYSTHAFRGVDDERSIVYQVRRDAPDGPVLKEGFLARSTEDWDFAGDGRTSPAPGKTFFRQHGHPVVFGVPAGALIGGLTPAHAGLFVAKWRRTARVLDKERNFLEHGRTYQQVHDASQGVEWVQFRLNAAGDDIDIVQPVHLLRQKNFESGPAICSGPDVVWMNQSFVRPVPFNADRSEWADCNHFSGGRVAALKYRFNPQTKLYEWTETGPMLADAKYPIFEASLCHLGNQWVFAARITGRSGSAWARCEDPFGSLPAPTLVNAPASGAPITAYVCADGRLRLFTGDKSISPHQNARDPLYCWDIDPSNSFAATNRQVVFDSVAAGVPIQPASIPKIDFCEALPQHDGAQLITFRVVTRAYDLAYTAADGKPIGIPAVTAEDKQACGIYHARLHFKEKPAAAWEFS